MRARLRQWVNEAGWHEVVLLAGTFVFALAVWVFAEMADDAVPGEYLETEARIMRAFRDPADLGRGLGGAKVESVVRDITALGSVVVLTLLVGLVVGLLVLKRRPRTALLVLAATLGGTLIGSVLKGIFERPRPRIVPHLMEVTSLSFPSGHSMMSSVVYLTLGAILAQTMARRREKVYLIGAAVFLAGLVGLSRVYLGVHYPTDVLAGWAAGTAWAIFCGTAAWWLQRRGTIKPAPSENE